jgi:hypothetical protein
MKVPSLAYKLYNQLVVPLVSNTCLHSPVHEAAKTISHAGIPKVDESRSTPISQMNWNNLIILDSCRHDEYEKVTGKDVDSRITCGSVTHEYLSANFSAGDWSDTVYVSGNPNTEQSIFEEETGRKPGDVFHEIFQVYKDNWIEEKGTDPEALVEKAALAAKLFPKKKLIVHIVKPHAPFVAREEDKNIVYERAAKGEIDPGEVKAAYRRNLQLGLDMAEQITDRLKGKTVITSDHGELLGENNRWSHRINCSDVPLRKVPWDIVKED